MGNRSIDPAQNISYSLRLRLNRGGTFFGPGVSDLLCYVEETRSLKTAAAEMGMAYSKAWRIINIAEKALGYPLIKSKVGGVDGGGSFITEEGKNLVKLFRDFQNEAYSHTDKLFTEFFHDTVSMKESTKNHIIAQKSII